MYVFINISEHTRNFSIEKCGKERREREKKKIKQFMQHNTYWIVRFSFSQTNPIHAGNRKKKQTKQKENTRPIIKRRKRKKKEKLTIRKKKRRGYLATQHTVEKEYTKETEKGGILRMHHEQTYLLVVFCNIISTDVMKWCWYCLHQLLTLNVKLTNWFN